MILTITQYIEALTSPDGRFRTLSRLQPVPDETETEAGSGVPLFAMPGHALVDFEVVADGKRYTLRCPLYQDAESAIRLRTLGEKDRGLGGRFFTEWSVLEDEIVLFGAAGRAFEVDILARPTPRGECFDDFLEKAAVRGDTAVLHEAVRSFGELTEWAQNAHRSGIVRRRLLVAPDGAISVTGFSANDESSLIADMLHAAATGEKPGGNGCGEFSVSKPDPLGEDPGYDPQGDKGIKCVRDGGGWMYVDSRNRPVIDAVWVSAAPFREGRAEVETRTGKGLIDCDGRAILEPVYEEVAWDDYWGLAAVMAEGRWSLLDRDGLLLTRETYDWLGECSEGFVLAQKDGKCGFLDAGGREAIPFIYDDATSFSEGCALVTLGAETYYIDNKGRRV